MIELKIQLKYFKLEMLIGKKSTPWFKRENADTGEIAEEGESPINTHQEDNPYENSFDEYMVQTPNTQISELAQKYQAELNNQGFPPETKTPPSTVLDINTNRAVVSSTSSSISLSKNEGIYDIGDIDDDPMSEDYKDYPDVEIMDDEYEVRLMKATKLANQRYATYKETHNID